MCARLPVGHPLQFAVWQRFFRLYFASRALTVAGTPRTIRRYAGASILLQHKELSRYLVNRLHKLRQDTDAERQITAAEDEETRALLQRREQAFKAMGLWVSDRKLQLLELNPSTAWPPEYDPARLRLLLEPAAEDRTMGAGPDVELGAWTDLFGSQVRQRLITNWKLAATAAEHGLWLTVQPADKVRAITMRHSLGKQYERLNIDSRLEDDQKPLPSVAVIGRDSSALTPEIIRNVEQTAAALTAILYSLTQSASDLDSRQALVVSLDQEYLDHLRGQWVGYGGPLSSCLSESIMEGAGVGGQLVAFLSAWVFAFHLIFALPRAHPSKPFFFLCLPLLSATFADLYTTSDRQQVVLLHCRRGAACARPARQTVNVRESTVDAHVQQELNANRRQASEALSGDLMSAQYYRAAVRLTRAFHDLEDALADAKAGSQATIALTEDEVRSAAFVCFKVMLQSLSPNLQRLSNVQELLLEAIHRFGQRFVKGDGPRLASLAALVLTTPEPHPLIARYFDSECNAEALPLIWSDLSVGMQANSAAAVRQLLSQVDIEGWLAGRLASQNHHTPPAATVARFVESLRACFGNCAQQLVKALAKKGNGAGGQEQGGSPEQLITDIHYVQERQSVVLAAAAGHDFPQLLSVACDLLLGLNSDDTCVPWTWQGFSQLLRLHAADLPPALAGDLVRRISKTTGEERQRSAVIPRWRTTIVWMLDAVDILVYTVAAATATSDSGIMMEAQLRDLFAALLGYAPRAPAEAALPFVETDSSAAEVALGAMQRLASTLESLHSDRYQSYLEELWRWYRHMLGVDCPSHIRGTVEHVLYLQPWHMLAPPAKLLQVRICIWSCGP